MNRAVPHGPDAIIGLCRPLEYLQVILLGCGLAFNVIAKYPKKLIFQQVAPFLTMLTTSAS
jgi:hypothetical protein